MEDTVTLGFEDGTSVTLPGRVDPGTTHHGVRFAGRTKRAEIICGWPAGCSGIAIVVMPHPAFGGIAVCDEHGTDIGAA